MVTEGSANFNEVLQGILEVTEATPRTEDVGKPQTVSIERMVHQAYILLRQQLERRVKLEPALYSKDRTEQALHDFERVLPDIQAEIAARAADSVSEFVRQEVRRVLRDALSDLSEAITNPVSSDEAAEITADTELSASKPEGTREFTEKSPPQGQDISQVPQRQGRGSVGSSDLEEVASPEAKATDEGVYQGNVKLSVEAQDGAKQVIQFLNVLNSNSALRVLRMVGTHGIITVWLNVQRPIPLKALLSEAEGVSKVSVRSSSQGSEPVLEVVLDNEPVLATGS